MKIMIKNFNKKAVEIYRQLLHNCLCDLRIILFE